MAPVRYHEGRFPPKALEWEALIPLVGPAAAAVARYDGMLAAVPNPDVLLSPLTTQEAVLSSRIEGTQATMGEVLEFEAGQETASPERRDDIREVLNYRAAMREAERLLATLPLSQRVIREAHRRCSPGCAASARHQASTGRFPTGSARRGATSMRPVSSPSMQADCPLRWTPGNVTSTTAPIWKRGGRNTTITCSPCPATLQRLVPVFHRGGAGAGRGEPRAYPGHPGAS